MDANAPRAAIQEINNTTLLTAAGNVRSAARRLISMTGQKTVRNVPSAVKHEAHIMPGKKIAKNVQHAVTHGAISIKR